MKFSRLSLGTITLFLAAMFLFGGRQVRSHRRRTRSTRPSAASKDWVAQIDAGKYEESYSFACDATCTTRRRRTDGSRC